MKDCRILTDRFQAELETGKPFVHDKYLFLPYLKPRKVLPSLEQFLPEYFPHRETTTSFRRVSVWICNILQQGLTGYPFFAVRHKKRPSCQKLFRLFLGSCRFYISDNALQRFLKDILRKAVNGILLDFQVFRMS